MIYLSIAVILFLVASLTQLVVSSLSIHWAIDPSIIIDHAFPFQAAFGLSIPLVCGSIIVFALLLLYSKSNLYLYLLTSLVCFIYFLLVSLTSPPSLNSWIQRWDQQWSNTSHPMSFQFEKYCCGWKDFKDRSISDCPFSFQSGCEPIVRNWITIRYNQIFRIEILLSAFVCYSILSFFWAKYHHHIEAIYAEIEIPFLQSNLYF